MNEEVLVQDEAQVDEAVPVPSPAPRNLGSLSLRIRLLVALCLSVGVVVCKVAAPGGAERLGHWIIGDGSERIQQAFFSMEEALGEGERLSEAWEAFCRELTDETA